jgi:diacylglycerol kinase family enzyme
VNEALQGVASTDVRLAIIPGGSANVWARSLGLPNDPVEATAVVLRRLAERESRTVSLGVANNRYFGFCAGWGYDGVIVRMVEERLLLKRTVRQATFVWCGLLAYLRTLKTDVTISLDVDGREVDDVFRTVIACNSDPYTFLGTIPARLCPHADLAAGLDLIGLRSLGFFKIARIAGKALTSGAVSGLRHVRCWHDRPSYELRATEPLALQVDGEYMGETERLALRSVPAACWVVA